MLAAARQEVQLGDGGAEDEAEGEVDDEAVKFNFVSFFPLATGGGWGKALGTQSTLAFMLRGFLKTANVKPR